MHREAGDQRLDTARTILRTATVLDAPHLDYRAGGARAWPYQDGSRMQTRVQQLRPVTTSTVTRYLNVATESDFFYRLSHRDLH